MPHVRMIPAALLLLSIAIAVPAQAARLFHGSRLVIAETEPIHDDVYATGGSVMIRGVIDGDVVAAGAQVGISGTVTGSVIVAGGDVQIYGNVGGTVRAAGGKVTVLARVGRDLVASGGQVMVEGDSIGRDALIAGGRVTLDGALGRNAHVATRRLALNRHADIGGNLDYASEAEAALAPGATVHGRVTRFAPGWTDEEHYARRRVLRQVTHAVRWVIGLTIFGLIVFLPFPGLARRCAGVLGSRPLVSFGVGIAMFGGLPIVACGLFVLGLLVGGWWIGGLVVIAWLALLAVGVVVSAVALGGRVGARVAFGWAMLLGLTLFSLLRLLPLFGIPIVLIAMLVGLGAFVLGARARTPA